MKAVVQSEAKTRYKNEFLGLGGRTLAGMATALLAAILIFAAPEVGLSGGIAAVVAGSVSAVLMRSHSVT